MKLSSYRVISPPVVDGRTGESKRVVFATRTAEARVLGEGAFRLLEEGRIDALPRDVLLDLVDIELLVPEAEDELKVILDRNRAAIHDADELYLVVQPTAWCQLGCDYCGQAHTKKQLGEEEQRLFLERARAKLSAKRYRALELAWFGAEPLSGLKVMRAMTPKLLAMTRELGVEYLARVVTNGLALTEDVAAELIHDLGVVHIEVTLDGAARFHDARRHTKGGLPTFDPIFTNLVRVAKRDDLHANISVRCNVDLRNHEGVSPLLRALADAGIQRRISFYVAPIHAWGNDAHRKSLSHEEFATWETRWFVEMIELGFNVKLLPGRKPVVCFAVNPASELVDAHGDLYNCSEVSYVPTYGDPNEYIIGNVASGETPGRRDRLGDFNDRVARGEYDCHTCRMLPVCGGSCPKLWDEGIPACPTAKFNIEDRLLLQYAVTRLRDRSPAHETA